jgi:hypothetical protein
MDKKARLVTEILAGLVLVAVISGVIFFLVQQGVVKVKSSSQEANVLNAEFLPYGREGSVVIKDFKFCNYVDANYVCLGEQSQFNFDSEIYFVFLAESSTYDHQIMLLENYRIKNPSGKIILDVGQKKNFNFEAQSANEKEQVAFRDSFIVLPGQESGEYTLELVVENPLLDKKTTLSEMFTVGNGEVEN